MAIIYAWPDGEWCFSDEYKLEEYRYKSDDYMQISVDDALATDQIEELVHLRVNGKSCPNCED